MLDMTVSVTKEENFT